MKEIESGTFLTRPFARVGPDSIRVVSWNINRGLQLNGIIDFLRRASADLILLQEADIGARRTGRRNIPREIARALRMDYIFGREFEELAQGSPATPAYHGQTTLSRLPLSHPRIIRFRDQSTFWRPRWFIPPLPCLQRRLGGRMALVCEIRLVDRTFAIYNMHLESRGGNELRISQLSQILTDVGQRPARMPVLMAGDFNFDLSRGPAASLIAESAIDSPFASLGGGSTILKSRKGRAAAIDWMLTRGTVATSHPVIHESTVASDHFPLSLELCLR